MEIVCTITVTAYTRDVVANTPDGAKSGWVCLEGRLPANSQWVSAGVSGDESLTTWWVPMTDPIWEQLP